MRGMIRANRRCVELGRSPEQSESIPLSPHPSSSPTSLRVDYRSCLEVLTVGGGIRNRLSALSPG